jgi:phosphatidate cytidylyltransferase
MLKQRLLTAVLLTPVIAVLLIAGGWWYALGVALALAVAGIEFVSLMRQGGYRPYQAILIVTILFIVGAQALGITSQTFGPGLSALLIASMTAMLAAYGNGDRLPAVNFGLTVGGALYIGWLGAHLVAMRQLPDGLHWSLIVIPAIAAGDSGAYAFGRRLGRHKMSPVVSPGKTWEGYAGGVLTAGLAGALCAALFTVIDARLHILDGILIGLLVGLIGPLGDLGISALKRMVGAKDSSHILPGHGGVLDRLDSVLIGVTISFYYIIYVAPLLSAG